MQDQGQYFIAENALGHTICLWSPAEFDCCCAIVSGMLRYVTAMINFTGRLTRPVASMPRYFFFLPFLFLLLLSQRTSAQAEAGQVRQYIEKGAALSGALDREGLQWLHKGLNLSRSGNDTAIRHAGLAAILHLARYYMLTGKYDTSKLYYNELVQQGKEYKDKYLVAKGTMGLGIVADYQSDYATSVALNQEALRYFEETKDSVNIASALGNIGNSYIRLRYYRESIPLYERAILLASAKNEKKLTANLMSSLGRVYNNTGEKEKELAFKLKAYAGFKEINYVKGIATVSGNLGNYYENANDLQQSLSYYRISLAGSRSINDQGNIAIMYNNLCDLYLKMGDPDKAMNCVDSALYFSAKSGDRLARSDALLEKSVLLHAGQRYDESVVYMDRYVSLRDSIYGDKMQLKIADMRVKYETEKKEQQILLLNQENSLQLLRLSNQELLVNNKQSQIIQQQQRLKIAGLQLNNQQEKLLSQLLLGQQQMDSIQDLKKQNKIQDLQLINRELQISRKNLMMILFIVLLGVLLLLGASLYRRYTLKRAQLKKEAAAALQLAHVQAAHDLQHEKLRIGKELHDNIGSHLTFVNTYLEQLGLKYADDRNITEAQSITLNTLKELRNAIWLINREEISLDAFVIKIREYLRTLPAGKIAATLEFNGNGDQVLRAEVVTHLFRIIQESVNNTLKYAAATSLQLSLLLDLTLQITIIDNGRGFDAAAVTKGNGLVNMEERAGNIGAVFSLESVPGQGTVIHITVPV